MENLCVGLLCHVSLVLVDITDDYSCCDVVVLQNSHLPTSEGKLAPAKVIQRTPPCITMDQISLLLVNHSIVITIHNCCSSDATGSLRSVFQDVFKPIRCSYVICFDICGILDDYNLNTAC